MVVVGGVGAIAGAMVMWIAGAPNWAVVGVAMIMAGQAIDKSFGS
jgi:hypothetical protein